jgi:hypothetical protein
MSAFVKNIADIQTGVKVEADTYFEAVDPYLIDSENEYIRPYLGDELFDAVQDEAYDAAKLAKILPSIKIAVSCFAFYHIIQEGSLKLNEHGAVQATGDMKTAPSKWRDDNAKAELIKRGDRAVDALLDILLENIEDFPEWENTKYHTYRTTLIISKALDFDEHVPICRSSRVFMRLLPDIRKANRLIEGIVCADTFDWVTRFLKGEITNEAELSALESLMPYLQAVVAYETIVRAIPRFNFFITMDGILFYTITDSTFTKASASMLEKKELTALYSKRLEEARSELVAFLNSNPDDYHLYAASPCSGQRITSKPYYAYPNLKTNKHFAP